jgi:hypothetical protein
MMMMAIFRILLLLKLGQERDAVAILCDLIVGGVLIEYPKTLSDYLMNELIKVVILDQGFTIISDTRAQSGFCCVET